MGIGFDEWETQILSAFCSYQSSKLSKAAQRTSRYYISNSKHYFLSVYREIKFSQKVMAVTVPHIFNKKKQTERTRAQSEAH